MTRRKHMKALFTVPEEVYKEFKDLAPEGSRSQVISQFMAQYVEIHKPQSMKIKPSLWSELKKHRKKKQYPKLNIKKLIKDAWNDVD